MGLTPDRPFFSIIVPVFNAEATLARCLAAIRSSTFSDWELIVIDDSSEDSSPAIAMRYADRFARLRQTQGPSHARNQGAKIARGHYLFFTDADCAVHPTTLAEAADLLRQHPNLDALIGSYDDQPASNVK